MASVHRWSPLGPTATTVVGMVALGVLGIVVGNVVATLAVLGLRASAVEITPFVVIALSLVSIQVLGLGLVSVIYLLWSGRLRSFIPVSVPDLPDVIWTVAGIVGMFVGSIAVGLLIQSTGVTTAQNSLTGIARDTPEVLLFLIPFAFLIIGPFEELLYRGVIQTRLREVLPVWPAIALASTVFGVAHITSVVGNGSLLGVAAALGQLSLIAVIPALAYERTGNLTVPVLIHGGYDAIVFGLQYLVFRFAPEAVPGWLLVLA